MSCRGSLNARQRKEQEKKITAKPRHQDILPQQKTKQNKTKQHCSTKYTDKTIYEIMREIAKYQKLLIKQESLELCFLNTSKC